MWIVRDKRGNLWVHQEKPTKCSRTWNSKGKYYYIHSDLFLEVKWSDEEPRELVLKPINEEQGFVNLYKDGGQVKVGWKIFPTKKEAEENFKDDEKYITTANIQWRDSNDNL